MAFPCPTASAIWSDFVAGLACHFLKLVETFLDGNVLLDWCNKFAFEGIVSKP